VSPEVVASTARELDDAGCYEVVVSDTIGVGTPGTMAATLSAVLSVVPAERVAVHCHDTYGQALANIYCALLHGISTVDSSVAGLGGCPFAGPGAAGNVATEDVVYMLNGLGIETGVDFDRVVAVGEWVVGELGRTNASKAALASLRRSPTAATGCGGGAPQPPTISLVPPEIAAEPSPQPVCHAARAPSGSPSSSSALPSAATTY